MRDWVTSGIERSGHRASGAPIHPLTQSHIARIQPVSSVAVLGAGDIGGAVASRLAARGKFRTIRLIDARDCVAAGKALDIQQTGPIDHSDTRLEGTADVLAAAGASVIVIADRFDAGEWQGDDGLTLIRRLAAAGTAAPFVFAGPSQTALMEAAARELRVPADRLVGTAASALVGAARSLIGLALDGAGDDVRVSVNGRPPSFVLGWSAATVAGSLVSDRLPAHRLLAIGRSLQGLWPPGPSAIAAATARVVEALAFGSRRLETALTVLDGLSTSLEAGEFGARHRSALLPLALDRGRVQRRVMPTLSRQELTEVESAIVGRTQ